MSVSEIPAPTILARWLLTMVAARSPQRDRHLREVLDHGDQLDALAGGGRGEAVEVGQRGDVGHLVKDDQERRVKRFAGAGGAVVDLGEHA